MTTASPRPDARRHQRESHGVGAVGDAHAILRAAIGRELTLERFDLLAADERGRAQRLAEHLHQLLLELAVRRHQIEKRNRLVRHVWLPGLRSVAVPETLTEVLVDQPAGEIQRRIGQVGEHPAGGARHPVACAPCRAASRDSGSKSTSIASAPR